MNYFSHILLNNIVPLSVMISLGALLYRAFKLDIRTLSKLNFYLFSPAVMLKMLYESSISFAVLGQVLLFFAIFFAVMFGVTEAAIRLRGYKNGMRSAVRNSVIFYNSANYAIPLNQLVFVGDAFTLSVQIVIMMMQNLLPNTYGIYSVNSEQQDRKRVWRTILSMPVIYIIPLAFTLRGFHVPIPHAIYVPLDYISNAFIATALLTLGVQLGTMKWRFNVSDVLLSNALRLCVGPLMGFAIVWALGFHGPLAQALVLSCSVPTSLSSVLLAVEFDNEPGFASQAVFASTIFSVFTVTFVIYAIHVFM